MDLWTVLRSGGDFKPEHVHALQRQLKRTTPYADLVCLTDIPRELDCHTVEMVHNWPGWWSKMDLFNPAIEGPMLYCDLDTVLLGNLSPLHQMTKTTVLRDFFCEQENGKWHGNVGSGFMFVTEDDRSKIWEHWIGNPKACMQRGFRSGDQAIIQEAIGPSADRWQDVFPGRIISYKTHIVRKRLTAPPPEAIVCCFHGTPRPWDVNDAWVREETYT